MANTFTGAMSNLGANQVPLPGVATMSTGGVSPPVVPPPTQQFTPIAPLPNYASATVGQTI